MRTEKPSRRGAALNVLLVLIAIAASACVGAAIYGWRLEQTQRHIVLQLYNVEGKAVAYVDRDPQPAVFARSRPMDLGWVSRDTDIEVRIFSGGGTYAWGIQVSAGGRLMTRDQAGVRDFIGAQSNDTIAAGRRVHYFHIHADGTDKVLRSRDSGLSAQPRHSPEIPKPHDPRDRLVAKVPLIAASGILALLMAVAGLWSRLDEIEFVKAFGRVAFPVSLIGLVAMLAGVLSNGLP